MAKIKSIKFYNFSKMPSAEYISFSVKFYDTRSNLILMDFSDSQIISKTGIYCETSEYIISSNSFWNYGSICPFECYQAFHTGNFNKELSISKIGYCWIPNNQNSSDNFLKIEFKIAANFSNIEILHSYCNRYGVSTFDYDIEYENGVEKTYNYTTNGKYSIYTLDDFDHGTYDQNTLDSLFESIEFSGTKQIYDSETGLIETLDTNNFRNISVNTTEKLKVLYTKPLNTYINCLVSFDQKQTWKTFNGTIWSTISNTSPENIILNCMDIETLNFLTKQNLIQAGFTGDLDFKIAIKTNDEKVTPSVSKIYITYKNPS